MRLSRPLALVCAAILTVSSASALTAIRSNQNIYVYNQKSNLSSYDVNGNNYVRARDFARVTGCSLGYFFHLPDLG